MIKSYWNKYPKSEYYCMVRRHIHLWEWVEEFIKDNDVKSIFEVGPGLSNNMHERVDIYQSVDLTKNGNSIYDDFTKMGLEGYIGKYDLVLGCGVIEHCSHYKEFFKQALKMKPKYIVISFFRGISNDYDYVKKVRSRTGEFLIYLNRYSQKEMEKELVGLNYQFITLNRRDSILIIKL